MYPFKGASVYVRNRWYIAAFSSEICSQPFERTILGTPVALYRTEEDKAVAMYGICPHRYYPLARGKVEGDALRCGYHGFTFAASGKCVLIPAQGTGAGFVQPVYPLEERGHLAWIWMGDPAKADPALIPSYEEIGLDQPGWVTFGAVVMPMKGRAQLLVDNLMDLTHLPFIHYHIPGGDAFLKGRFEQEEGARGFRLKRFSQSPWTGFYTILYGDELKFDGMSEMLTVTDFFGPELLRTTGPITTRIDGREDVPAGLGQINFLHGITPETENSANYFCFMSRNFRLEDRALDQILVDMDTHVRQQDVEAIGLVESRLERSATIQRELLAKADAPAIRVRGMVQEMIDAEA